MNQQILACFGREWVGWQGPHSRAILEHVQGDIRLCLKTCLPGKRRSHLYTIRKGDDKIMLSFSLRLAETAGYMITAEQSRYPQASDRDSKHGAMGRM